MASRIEQLIDEIEDYIDNCKYQSFSNTKIIVNKEEIEELLRELRSKTPEELKRYQKVVSNQQAILNDAKAKAQALIDDAANRTSEMLSQNAIMQQAYAQADEVVKSAYVEARSILTNATNEANAIRTSVFEYMDDMLARYEAVTSQTLNLTQSHYESFYSQISQLHNTVVANRMELNPPIDENIDYGEYSEEGEPIADNQEQMSNTGSIPNTNTGNIPTVASNTGNINLNKEESGDLKLDLLS